MNEQDVMFERLVEKMRLVRLQRNATKQCRLWFGRTARCFGIDVSVVSAERMALAGLAKKSFN